MGYVDRFRFSFTGPCDSLWGASYFLDRSLSIRFDKFHPGAGRGNSEANNATDWNLLSRIRIKCCNEPTKLNLCWTRVSLVTLSNEAESRKRNASEAYALGRNNDAVHARSMGQNRLDVSKINSHGNRSDTLVGVLFPKLNETFAIKILKFQPSKYSLKECKARKRLKGLPTS